MNIFYATIVELDNIIPVTPPYRPEKVLSNFT